MSNLKIPEPIWITNNQALKDACLAWQQEPFLAVDTEFVRVSTFYPQAGLVQICASTGSFLIDPLCIDDWQPLAEILTHPFVVKVFHACLEDLEVCRRLTGTLPSPIADTQLAAAFVGFEMGLSFQRLLKEVLHLDLAKEETRSNWLQRPLNTQQIRYAVADVHYLYKLYPKLILQLKARQREAWFAEDSARLLESITQADERQNYYKRIKLAWKLRPQELLLLQQLSLWRENLARKNDVPRSRILDDNELWSLARFKPEHNEKLAKLGLKPAFIREHGAAILTMAKDVLAVKPESWPKTLERPLGPEAGEVLKTLKDMVAERAQELAIPSDLLANKKALSALLKSGYQTGHYRLPEVLSLWRKAEIADNLIIYLQELYRRNHE